MSAGQPLQGCSQRGHSGPRRRMAVRQTGGGPNELCSGQGRHCAGWCRRPRRSLVIGAARRRHDRGERGPVAARAQRRPAAGRRADRQGSTACPAPSCRPPTWACRRCPGSPADQRRRGSDPLVAGSNTARVWYAGHDKVRLALLGTLGETDVIRNGTDVWMWRSSDNTATHLKLTRAGRHGGPGRRRWPAGCRRPRRRPPTRRWPRSTRPPRSPRPAAAGGRAGRVRAGARAARTPRRWSAQVRLAIDAEEHIPLRVDVYAKAPTTRRPGGVHSRSASTVPDAEQFTFNPPPGAKVNEGHRRSRWRPQARPDAEPRSTAGKAPQAAHGHRADRRSSARAGRPCWWPRAAGASEPRTPRVSRRRPEQPQTGACSSSLPKVSGTWGSGACSPARCSARCSPTTAGSGRRGGPGELYEARGA